MRGRPPTAPRVPATWSSPSANSSATTPPTEPERRRRRARRLSRLNGPSKYNRCRPAPGPPAAGHGPYARRARPSGPFPCPATSPKLRRTPPRRSAAGLNARLAKGPKRCGAGAQPRPPPSPTPEEPSPRSRPGRRRRGTGDARRRLPRIPDRIRQRRTALSSAPRPPSSLELLIHIVRIDHRDRDELPSAHTVLHQQLGCSTMDRPRQLPHRRGSTSPMIVMLADWYACVASIGLVAPGC
ncbi:hypothetical protein SMICM304S_05960 [Streptomyces microflavus]